MDIDSLLTHILLESKINFKNLSGPRVINEDFFTNSINSSKKVQRYGKFIRTDEYIYCNFDLDFNTKCEFDTYFNNKEYYHNIEIAINVNDLTIIIRHHFTHKSDGDLLTIDDYNNQSVIFPSVVLYIDNIHINNSIENAIKELSLFSKENCMSHIISEYANEHQKIIKDIVSSITRPDKRAPSLKSLKFAQQLSQSN